MQQVQLTTRACRYTNYKVTPPMGCEEPADYDGFCRRHRLRHLAEAEIGREKVAAVLAAVERFLDCAAEATRTCYEGLQEAYWELKQWERRP